MSHIKYKTENFYIWCGT